MKNPGEEEQEEEYEDDDDEDDDGKHVSFTTNRNGGNKSKMVGFYDVFDELKYYVCPEDRFKTSPYTGWPASARLLSRRKFSKIDTSPTVSTAAPSSQ